MHAGAFDDASALARDRRAVPLDDAARARVDLVRAEISFATDRGNDALPLLLAAAAPARAARREARARHLPRRALARRCSPDAWRRAPARTGGRGRAQGSRTPSHRARATRCCTGSPCCSPTGTRAAAPRRTARCEAFAAGTLTVDEALRFSWLAAATAASLWDDACWDVLSRRHLEVVRADGRAQRAPPGPATPAASCSCSPVIWRRPRRLAEETRVRHGGDGEHPGALRRGLPRRPARSRGGGRAVDPELPRGRSSPARGRHRGEHGAVGPRRAVQRPRPVRGSGRGRRPRPPPTRASSAHPSGRSPSSSRPRCAAGRTGRRRAALERLSALTRASGTDWALGDRGEQARAALHGRHRRRPAPRGDRAAGPHPRAGRARPRTAALRRMAAAGRPHGSTPARSCGPPTRRWRRWASRRSPTARGASSWPPARRCASGRSRRRGR